jgi:hypothetical protein
MGTVSSTAFYSPFRIGSGDEKASKDSRQLHTYGDRPAARIDAQIEPPAFQSSRRVTER